MLTDTDREAIRASLVEIRATQTAMLDDIGEIAVMRWLKARGWLMLRNDTNALIAELQRRGYSVEPPQGWPPMGDGDE